MHTRNVWVTTGLCLVGLLVLGGLADVATGWFARAFDAVAHQFYEIPMLAAIRRPSQLSLARFHVVALGAIAAFGLLCAPRLDRHRCHLWIAFCVAYAVRAAIWTAGGNLPLVPGDSSHYIEVASSIYRGEGPVKHYVESYFIPYPAIRAGRGVLDDWATPLFPYLLAGTYRLTGIVPGESIEKTLAVAKGASFVLNLLCLPALYGLARRAYGRNVGLISVWLLAILPVHAIYAGFELRESLVALTSIAAVWASAELWHARRGSILLVAIAAGALGGLAILARNTAMVLLAVCTLYGMWVHWRTRGLAICLSTLVLLVTIAPWARTTYVEYGEPFYTYTKFFQYTFSWTVHHYQTGVPRAADFYTLANAPEIIRVKIKALVIIVVYSVMMLSLPIVVAAAQRWLRQYREDEPIARDMDRLSLLFAAGFAIATLTAIADVTQVAQLGRYYLPVYCLIVPTAAAGIACWNPRTWPSRLQAIAAASLTLLLWANPTWAYDASWLVKPFQLHLPALRAAGEWVRQHPDAVAADARIMTWFPWELRLFSQRTTILMPRNFDARRNLETIGDGPFGYHVTHVLWGSFETPPDVDPELFGPYLERVRIQTGLTDAKEIFHSAPGLLYPVRLFHIRDRDR